MKYIYCIQRLYSQSVFLARFLCEACLVCHARVRDLPAVPGLEHQQGPHQTLQAQQVPAVSHH